MVNRCPPRMIATNTGRVDLPDVGYFDECVHLLVTDQRGTSRACLSLDQLKALRNELDIRIAVAEGAFE